MRASDDQQEVLYSKIYELVELDLDFEVDDEDLLKACRSVIWNLELDKRFYHTNWIVTNCFSTHTNANLSANLRYNEYMSTLHHETLLETCFEEAIENFRVHNELSAKQVEEMLVCSAGTRSHIEKQARQLFEDLCQWFPLSLEKSTNCSTQRFSHIGFIWQKSKRCSEKKY